MTPSEENCKGCPSFEYWYGPYSGWNGVPACNHRSFRRMRLIPDEIDNCPEEKAKNKSTTH